MCLSFPSFELENVFCDRWTPLEERLDQIMGLLPGQIVDDMEGSGDYREFLFRNTVKEVLGQLEGVEYGGVPMKPALKEGMMPG